MKRVTIEFTRYLFDVNTGAFTNEISIVTIKGCVFNVRNEKSRDVMLDEPLYGSDIFFNLCLYNKLYMFDCDRNTDWRVLTTQAFKHKDGTWSPLIDPENMKDAKLARNYRITWKEMFYAETYRATLTFLLIAPYLPLVNDVVLIIAKMIFNSFEEVVWNEVN